MKLAAGPTCHAERFAQSTNSAERLAPSTDGDLKAIARRCLERMLGRPLTHDDAAILPGIDVSALLAARQGFTVPRDRLAHQLHAVLTTSGT
jgi:hypothetical protein